MEFPYLHGVDRLPSILYALHLPIDGLKGEEQLVQDLQFAPRVFNRL